MTYEYQQYLAHYGVKGQKWGQRNYQNEDGSYTAEGAERYWGGGHGRQPGAGPTAPAAPRSAMKRSTLNRVTRGFTRLNAPQKWRQKAYNAVYHPEDTPEQKAARKERRKKIVAISAGVAVAAIAAYGIAKSRSGSSGRSIQRLTDGRARANVFFQNTGIKMKTKAKLTLEKQARKKIRGITSGNTIAKQKKPNYIKSAKRTYDTLRSYTSGRSDEHIYKSLKKRKRVGG